MRISHKYKFVFIAIPRTASTAVRSALNSYSDISGGPYEPFYSHVKARELKIIFSLNNWKWNDYYKFCFVRCPYERVYSNYRLITSKSFCLRPKVYSDFSEWALNSEGVNRKYLKSCRFLLYKLLSSKQNKRNIFRAEKHLRHLWEPESEWIFDENGKSLIDYIGYYENLQNDFEEICRNIGLPKIKLKYKNVDKGVKKKANYNFQKIYDQTVSKLIYEKFREDFLNFKYEI